ncbi:hypothetical protein DFR50_10571 [Roseiarcus fermentans]|uniref:PemK-like, MazF-like toxin of type II toxin-antitoxin system n=1 Tax=Roseiarcus fermentans TaxID=1473586 RepID=A0A366FRS4_9HYPH|nr:hypothetical protein [Roseiarcus fermentans]RBP16429.1 hypothetical protein DFR50_10571 [Roseiarcus fermentans]
MILGAVLVLPITRSPPGDPASAVEIPTVTKKRLGLDDGRSWILLTEWNEFVWPGPDLRRLPNRTDATVAYGVLPPSLFAAIRERFLTVVSAGRARRIPRL